MRIYVVTALIAGLALAGCGGSSVPSGSAGNGGTPPESAAQRQSENSIETANALGDPLQGMSSYETSIATPTSQGGSAAQNGSGCNDGAEFNAPDLNGDPNSTETQYFYDSACTELALDVVRIYTVNGTSETVNRTEKEYALNNTTPIEVRLTAVSFINGTFGKYGFPIVADGFARSATGTLDLSGTKTFLGDGEMVMMPSSSSVSNYCDDNAGYNATGIAALNETFGWEGGVSSGTRTNNGSGSVTWQSTNAGQTFKAPIGSLSIAAGSPNTQCPIATPEYSLSGGMQGGSYSIPITATFLHGELVNLSVTGATLANGNSLAVTTNTNLFPANTAFITGTISNGGTQISTFSVNALGEGTLTVTSSGAQYVIDDWHVD